MKTDSDQRGQSPDGKRPEHREQHRPWPVPTRGKSPTPAWNSKTMHHPAFRVGEIKHGKT
jgi:hypothetical protein